MTELQRVEFLAPVGESDLVEGWHITDLSALEWALERVGAAKAEIEENTHLLDEAITRLRARVELINQRALRTVVFFEAKIVAYMDAHREELLRGGKRKSRALPAGTVGWRKAGGKLRVVDEIATLRWACEQPSDSGLTRPRVELDKKALAEWCATTGEVPPGCELEPERDEPYVKPAEPELQLALPSKPQPAKPEKEPFLFPPGGPAEFHP